MVGVEDAARLGDVDRLGLRRRPGQLDQRVEVGPDHAVLGRRLRRALQAAQLLARRLLDLGRHPGLADRLLEVGDLLLVGALVAQLLLDRRHLLAQQHLALARVERRLGLAADLGRQPQHLEPVGEQLRHLVESRHQVDRLQHVLLLGSARRRDRWPPGRPAGRARSVASTVWRSSGGTRGSSSSTSRTCPLQHEEARLDFRAVGAGLGHVDAARQQEGIALDELGDAEALHALADQVMAALRAGHVAHDVGDRADAMEIVRADARSSPDRAAGRAGSGAARAPPAGRRRCSTAGRR